MPTPIRPINDKGKGFFSNPRDSEIGEHYSQEMFAIPGNYSPPEDEAIETNSIREAKVKFRKASPEQLKLLYSIWEHGNQLVVQAQIDMGIKSENVVYQIPKSMGYMDVAKLVTAHFIEKLDNNTVRFTEAGKMALSKEIMRQPSTFESPEKLQKLSQKKSKVNLAGSED